MCGWNGLFDIRLISDNNIKRGESEDGSELQLAGKAIGVERAPHVAGERPRPHGQDRFEETPPTLDAHCSLFGTRRLRR